MKSYTLNAILSGLNFGLATWNYHSPFVLVSIGAGLFAFVYMLIGCHDEILNIRKVKA